jgi:hypothetical protein
MLYSIVIDFIAKQLYKKHTSINSHRPGFPLELQGLFQISKRHPYPCAGRHYWLLRLMLQVRLNDLGADKTSYFNYLIPYLILYRRTKRKQALLRSILPGIHPVADEVIRRYQVWFIQTFFVPLLLKPTCLKKNLSRSMPQRLLHTLFCSSIQS